MQSVPRLRRDADGRPRRRAEQDPSGRADRQGPVRPAAGRGRRRSRTVCASLDQALEHLDKDREFLTARRRVHRRHDRRLHRAEDAGGHALPHDDASGRVRHVLQPVSRVALRQRGTAAAVAFRAWATRELRHAACASAMRCCVTLRPACRLRRCRRSTAATTCDCASLVAARRCALVAARAGARADLQVRSYRCAGNALHEHASGQGREELGCKRIDGAPVTVIADDRAARRRRRGAVGRGAADGPRVDADDADGRDATRAASSRTSCEPRRSCSASCSKEYNNGEPEPLGDEQQRPEVPRPRRRAAGRRSRRNETRHRGARSARSRSCRAAAAARDGSRACAAGADRAAGRASAAPRPAGDAGRRASTPDGAVRVRQLGRSRTLLGLSRRSMIARLVFDWFAEPQRCCATPSRRVGSNEFVDQPRSSARCVRRRGREPLPRARRSSTRSTARRRSSSSCVRSSSRPAQEREERAARAAAGQQELIRNLAHEIKNPLGGIRGAAQLLEMRARVAPQLTRVHAGDHQRGRPAAALVDRLLAPHRAPHVVGDVNIHEVLRARARR